MLKLIPRGLKGVQTPEKLNKKLQENIDKINKNTPKKLTSKNDTKRPQPTTGTGGTNIRGVLRSAEHGKKLNK